MSRGDRMTPTGSVDLDALARERSPAPALSRPRRRLRIVLPLVLLAAFGAMLVWSLGGALRGALAVRVVRPVPVTGVDARQAHAGEVVAQAAGWIEPDPFPIRVTALAPGVVREMLVQESDVVAAGDPIARLVDDEAHIAVQGTRASLARAQADRDAAKAERDAARASFEAALELVEREKSAHARADGRRAEAELRAQAVVKGRAQVTIAEEEIAVQRYLSDSGAAGPRQLELAGARLDEARGELASLEAEAALAAADAREAEAVLERVLRDRELRIEDRLRAEAGEARLALSEAMCAEAEAALAGAQLVLERMTVRAPVGGVVLERLATIGSELAGESSVAVTLYDPTSVRVRVDVPQQDLAALFAGQEARVESDARPGAPYRGEVLRIVRRADIQKVTLQAHVRLLDGDELLRPEMLVQVRFLAPAPAVTEEAAAPAEEQPRVAIPARLVVDGARVWTIDGESGRAVLSDVRLGARRGELVVIEEGLDLSDKLIDADPASLKPGLRVRAEVRP